jgi:hypothetical protein
MLQPLARGEYIGVKHKKMHSLLRWCAENAGVRLIIVWTGEGTKGGRPWVSGRWAWAYW